jgi:hypothetical protein
MGLEQLELQLAWRQRFIQQERLRIEQQQLSRLEQLEQQLEQK